jgi:hypothetical protein
LTYGAVFGPDAIDVSEWMGMIERAVDGVPDASVIEDWQNETD